MTRKLASPLLVLLVAAVTCYSATAHSRSSLSGIWTGSYSGTYHGTFVLKWKQSGSALTGTIKLVQLNTTPNITGTVVRGGGIRFGTVGSTAITYTGTVSGSSMSGNYHTRGGNGTWSAKKISRG